MIVTKINGTEEIYDFDSFYPISLLNRLKVFNFKLRKKILCLADTHLKRSDTSIATITVCAYSKIMHNPDNTKKGRKIIADICKIASVGYKTVLKCYFSNFSQ